jgi:RNA polymerase sigma factor (TIGR02999 family)
MSDVTNLLSAIEQGNPAAADKLLPLVYDELRRLAAQKIAQERPGQTLQATALVHEAYLRLVDVATPQSWNSRGHFFAAAAEAMRRILIENARGKHRTKRGGSRRRIDLDRVDAATSASPDDLLLLDELITRLDAEDAPAAAFVKLRFFSGLSTEEAAETLGISRAQGFRHWTHARAWLHCEIERQRKLNDP